MCEEGMTNLVTDIFPVTNTLDDQVDALIDLEINGRA
jgi:hypothetical protein